MRIVQVDSKYKILLPRLEKKKLLFVNVYL